MSAAGTYGLQTLVSLIQSANQPHQLNQIIRKRFEAIQEFIFPADIYKISFFSPDIRSGQCCVDCDSDTSHHRSHCRDQENRGENYTDTHLSQ